MGQSAKAIYIARSSEQIALCLVAPLVFEEFELGASLHPLRQDRKTERPAEPERPPERGLVNPLRSMANPGQLNVCPSSRRVSRVGGGAVTRSCRLGNT